MSCSLNSPIPKAWPPLSRSIFTSLSISSEHKTFQNEKPQMKQADRNPPKISNLAIPVAMLLATAEQPAFGVTGVNNEEDFLWVLTQLAIVAFGYFLSCRVWTNHIELAENEMTQEESTGDASAVCGLSSSSFQGHYLFAIDRSFYDSNLQEMIVLLWVPFLNFRKFPRDPSLKHPWSTPEDPSKIKIAYLMYPWPSPEDY
ncbi:hypothetical protein RJ641_012147 [Dillenia turbinata]|uniref:Uncharacterized protein n=1 Tax=Dillenia turbinata TaxID=194707 RepID=A0AAN8UTB7_9MAGN